MPRAALRPEPDSPPRPATRLAGRSASAALTTFAVAGAVLCVVALVGVVDGHRQRHQSQARPGGERMRSAVFLPVVYGGRTRAVLGSRQR